MSFCISAVDCCARASAGDIIAASVGVAAAPAERGAPIPGATPPVGTFASGAGISASFDRGLDLIEQPRPARWTPDIVGDVLLQAVRNIGLCCETVSRNIWRSGVFHASY